MKRLSKSVKEAKGTLRKSREKVVSVDFKDPSDDLPHELSEGAKKIWERIFPILKETKVISEADLDSLVIFCEELSLCYILDLELRKEKRILELKNGDGMVINYRVNPKIEIRNKALDKVIAIGSQFGLNPLSRNKITVKEKEEDTPEKQNLKKLKELQGKIVPITKIA